MPSESRSLRARRTDQEWIWLASWASTQTVANQGHISRSCVLSPSHPTLPRARDFLHHLVQRNQRETIFSLAWIDRERVFPTCGGKLEKKTLRFESWHCPSLPKIEVHLELALESPWNNKDDWARHPIACHTPSHSFPLPNSFPTSRDTSRLRRLYEFRRKQKIPSSFSDPRLKYKIQGKW